MPESRKTASRAKREERLAKALKDNLGRRKEQQRKRAVGRSGQASAGEPGGRR